VAGNRAAAMMRPSWPCRYIAGLACGTSHSAAKLRYGEMCAKTGNEWGNAKLCIMPTSVTPAENTQIFADKITKGNWGEGFGALNILIFKNTHIKSPNIITHVHYLF
jgi:hypothetical protein